MRTALLVSVLGAAALAAACVDDDGSDPAPNDSCGTPPEGCIGFAQCEIDAEEATCGGDVWECQDGEWEHIGFCDPAYTAPEGELSMIVGLGDPIPEGCPSGVLVRTPLVVAMDGDGGFTAEAPIVVVAAAHDPLTDELHLELSDVWESQDGPVDVTLELDVSIDDDGWIAGDGTVTASDACAIFSEVGGEYHEAP
jgi:hypothetical protein